LDINFIGPINQLGYGVATLNILKSLAKSNNISLWIIGQGQAPQDDVEVINKCRDNCYLFNKNAPCLRIWHQNDMAMMVGKGLHAGMPIFELDKFTDIEKHNLKSLDHIFVNSKWAADIVKQEIGASNVSVAPLGVDTSIFKPLPVKSKNSNATTFLNVGKWEVRKGHDVLLQAFNKAFEPSDNVRLIMNCHNPFLKEGVTPITNEKWVADYKSSKMGDKIDILEHRLDTQQMLAQIMNIADCGVFPARAEGWNLDLLEMMACGKMVITTNYSAHTEFCNGSNSLLIPIKDKELAYDGVWFKGQGSWAEIGDDEIDTLIRHMRYIHKNKQDGASLHNHEGIVTAQKFSWDNSAEQILGVLNARNSNKGFSP
jgi:glycosyltransferase involved in cell wall biosynthesis